MVGSVDNVTIDERNALRKKHQHLEVSTDDCGYVAEFHICDVLRVLDAWEEAERRWTAAAPSNGATGAMTR